MKHNIAHVTTSINWIGIRRPVLTSKNMLMVSKLGGTKETNGGT